MSPKAEPLSKRSAYGVSVSEEPLRVVYLDRIGPIVDGVVRSRSRSEKGHYGRVHIMVRILATTLCGCEDSYFGGRACAHLRAILEALPKEELVDAILEASTDPDS